MRKFRGHTKEAQFWLTLKFVLSICILENFSRSAFFLNINIPLETNSKLKEIWPFSRTKIGYYIEMWRVQTPQSKVYRVNFPKTIFWLIFYIFRNEKNKWMIKKNLQFPVKQPLKIKKLLLLPLLLPSSAVLSWIWMALKVSLVFHIVEIPNDLSPKRTKFFPIYCPNCKAFQVKMKPKVRPIYCWNSKQRISTVEARHSW